jgi:pimeloyl-ACP methyl ester carboxylesterase
MKRRGILKTKAIADLAAGAGGVAAKAQTFVLVHGAWHGGWCWSRVADRLRAAGHRVFTPTQTGLGERKHLLSKAITLDTFAKDIVNVIEAEELSSIILVGHSFGGLAISGVADAMPDKVRHLVYLDSLMVEGGKSPFDNLPPDIVYPRRRQRRSEFRMQKIPTGSNAGSRRIRLTPTPVRSTSRDRSATTCRAPTSPVQIRLMRRLKARASGSRRSRDGAGPKSPPATTPW